MMGGRQNLCVLFGLHGTCQDSRLLMREGSLDVMRINPKIALSDLYLIGSTSCVLKHQSTVNCTVKH